MSTMLLLLLLLLLLLQASLVRGEQVGQPAKHSFWIDRSSSWPGQRGYAL
jgi:hypothetical protein